MTETKLTTNQELGEMSYHKKEEKIFLFIKDIVFNSIITKMFLKKYDSYSEHFFVRVIQSNLLQE